MPPSPRHPSKPRRPPPPPLQQALPLAPPEPTPQEVQAEVLRLLRVRPWWRCRYGKPEAVLADPERAALLWNCARRALQARRAAQCRPT